MAWCRNFNYFISSTSVKSDRNNCKENIYLKLTWMVISLKAPTGTLTNGESAVYKSFSDTVINTSGSTPRR
jgi:hypothetical protein